MILLIDNYDSFVCNLARYFERLGQKTLVVRNDAITIEKTWLLAPDAIVISPGPCTPQEAGISLEMVNAFVGKLPILGVCLGHQVIAAALGSKIRRADNPMHGCESLMQHDGRGVFQGLPNPMQACRYHSLVVDRETLPKTLIVSAHLEDGTIMALRHRQHPVVGVQFHPESILTPDGFHLLANFLTLSGLSYRTKASFRNEFEESRRSKFIEPSSPVTF